MFTQDQAGMMQRADDMDINIKRASASDNDELFNQLSAIDRICVGAEGWSAASFKSEAEKDCGIVLYIEENGAVIALLCGYYAIGEGDITSVAVSPDHRRKGLALKMIQKFESLLPDDTENIFLEARESNHAARSLYEKSGFSVISVRKNFYRSPLENAVVMMKKFTR